MSEPTPQEAVLSVRTKKKRGRLPGLVRYLVIALWGALLAAVVSYLLRKVGF